MAVCSEIHTKHINTLCGQNVELLNVKLAVRIVTTGLETVKSSRSTPCTVSFLRHKASLKLPNVLAFYGTPSFSAPPVESSASEMLVLSVSSIYVQIFQLPS